MSRPRPKRQRSKSLDSGQKVSKPRVDKAGDTVKAAMRTLLRGVTEASDAFSPLKSAAGGLSFILNTVDQMGDNRATAEKLSRRIEKISAYIGRPQIDGEEARRLELSCELDSARRILEPLDNQGRVGRFIHSSQNASLIEKYITSVDKAIADYQMYLIEGLHRVSVEQLTRGQRKAIEKLTRAKDAGFDAYSHRSRCLAGTRVEVLHTLYHWATGSDSRQVYWLNGHAGSGKSTIAQSFAETLAAAADLGASFFCSRDSQQRSDLKMIFPTIAYQLARARNVDSPAYRGSLLRALEADPDIAFSSLHNQLQKLIISPAKESGIRTVIVIDALDECRDPNPTSIILDLISSAIVHVPAVKVFITSRPEPHIRSGFRLPQLKPLTEVMLLHEVNATSVDSDIKLFLRHKLDVIAEDRRGEHVGISYDWPLDSDLEIVTGKAAGLFIFAATVVKFIETRHHDPRDRLRTIINNLDNSRHEGRSGLDTLYLSILREVAPDPDDREFLDRLRSILGLLVIANDFLHPSTIADLVNMPHHVDGVLATLSALHSLVMVPDSIGQPIRFHHKSFPDFLTDRDRCTCLEFLITPELHHSTIAQRCLQVMRQNLKKNLTGLPRYATNDSLADALRDQLFKGATGYGCRYWADHVLSTHVNAHLLQLEPFLQYFLTAQQLQWFEVLGLVRELRLGVESLNKLRTWLSKPELPYSSRKNLLAWVIDGYKFVLHAFDVINDSVSHIYHSALVFAPEDSLLKKHHCEDLSGEARVLVGLVSTWDKSIKTVSMPGIVYAVACAHNGTMLAAGGKGFVRVLHSSTGEKMYNFAFDPSHMDHVAGALAFSSDDCIVAATVDDFLYLWDVRTGTRSTTKVLGNIGSLVNIMFHPRNHGQLLSRDKQGTMLGVWDVTKCRLEQSLYTLAVCVACCWLNGSRQKNILIAYQSHIDICDWNNTNGPLRVIRTCAPRPPCAPLQAVASSEDGSFVASSSCQGSIIIYDTNTGHPIRAMESPLATSTSIDVCSLRFLPTSLHTGTIPDICHVHCPLEATAPVTAMVLHSQQQHSHYTAAFSGHLGRVLCLASSPRGTLIVTGSMDKTLKFWETGSTSTEDWEKGLAIVDTPEPVQSTAGLICRFSAFTKFLTNPSVNWSPMELFHGRSSRHFDPKCLATYSALSVLQDDHILLYDRSDDSSHLREWSLEEIGGTTKAILVRMTGKQWSTASFTTFDLPRTMSAQVPFRHGASGFYCSFVGVEGRRSNCMVGCYVGIECWKFFSDPDKGSYLVKLARGRISQQSFRRRPHPPDRSHPKLKPVHIVQLWDTPDPLDSSWLVVYIRLSSGERYSFTWKPATQFNPSQEDEPQTLNFVSRASYHCPEELFQISPLFGSSLVHDIPFSKVVDSNGASWVLDEKGRKILWVPPAHDGQTGRWWRREMLLLEGEYDRLTMLDFSKVNFDEERPF